MRRFFNVQSETSPLQSYTVAENSTTGELECSCPGFQHHRKCKHMDLVLMHLQRDLDKKNGIKT